jgi:uncharacterized protein YndB with AHSA1/START domain
MTAATKNKTELTVTRVFDASRGFVWKVWTDPEEVRKWWGPKDYTAPYIRIDFRVGGKFVYCMRGAELDGVVKDFWNTGEHLEIVSMEKIVTTMSFADEHGNPVPASHYGLPGEWPAEIMVTATFEDIEGRKTKITVREVGLPGVMTELASLGWNQSFDKLTEILTTKTSLTRITAEPGKQEIIIEREFDAPREIIFKAFTDPKLLIQWLGPRILTMTLETFEPKNGGAWRFIHKDRDGNAYAFGGVHHEVANSERIIRTFEFEGLSEKGHVSLETARFEEMPGGKTRLTVQSVFQSVADRDGMLQSGMEEGVKDSYDRLDELLEKMQKEQPGDQKPEHGRPRDQDRERHRRAA